jgi:DNA-binding MarR family transcriptional regulator
MKPAHISKIAAKLEKAGLTTRVRSQGDQRSVLIALTDAGRQIGDRIAAAAERSSAAALAGSTPEEVHELRRALAKFARHAVQELDSLSGDDPARNHEPD